ncbi:sodium:proton exchanger [Zhengella mangrovi]|uniref:Sodium:proton exchanger n=1 Tax=Zhengella mangrovi TaxID=1982044 RepID=A0A2G1QRS4_9HYPH|nr:calcium/sodium antiporter [Zhengella mangrovi]PHP68223.1 sodium:proton exchanger [Zhengella mangrovi]
MILSFFILAAGLILLVFAGDYLVRGAVGLAENLGISPLVIGLTVVAFGTSAPELFISTQAALGGSPGIAIGNVVGSNIANVLLVVGIPALIAPLAATEPGLRRNMTAMLAATAVFLFMLANGVVGRLEGAILFAFLIAYIGWQIHMARARHEAPEDYHEEIGEAPHDKYRIGLSILGGLIGLPIGAQLTVMGASDIASAFGVSDEAIGLTVVAVGTSLPELATTLTATLRRSSAVAIGNVVGSNLFNILCIMGITAMIVPVDVPQRIIAVDGWVMAGTTVILATLAFARLHAGKAIGAAMVLAYAAYTWSIFVK